MPGPVNPLESGSPAAVHAAAQIDQALRTSDEGGENVGGNDVHREHARPGVDTGVVDDGVHGAERVHLVSNLACLLEVGGIPQHRGRTPCQQRLYGGQPMLCAHVNDDLVPVGEQRLRRRLAETVGGTGDEDACHGSRYFFPSASLTRPTADMAFGQPT